MSANPDLIVSSVWGGDYVALYKQALRYGMFNNAKFASTIAFGVAPHAIGKDHPEGVIAGVHSNYYFTFPPGNRWPANKTFVEKYFKRWNEYPNFQSDGAYHTLYMYKTAIEKANKLVGGWPDEEAIISQLEGMYFETAAGYLYIRPDNHQGYKDAVTGFSKNVAEYPFQILDPDRMITIPIRNITAPPGWPKPGNGHNDPTATYNWIKETWPQVGLKLAASRCNACRSGARGRGRAVAGRHVVRSMVVRHVRLQWCLTRALSLCMRAAVRPAPAARPATRCPTIPRSIRRKSASSRSIPERRRRNSASKTDPLHAYLGASPRFAGEPAAHLRSVEFAALVHHRERQCAAPRPRAGREARCRAMAHAATALATHPDVVPHRYPITPYHADYIGHVDPRAEARRRLPQRGAGDHARSVGSEAGTDLRIDRLGHRFDEVPVAEVLRARRRRL